MTVFEAVKKRRTIRKFKQIPIERQLLIKYIDAARVAPSAANLQPLKYALVNDPDTNQRVFELLKWAGYLGGEYDPKEAERPTAYIVVCADTNIRKTGYGEDAGAAVQSLILAALEDGIGACWIGSVDRPALAELLNLPENLAISSVIALGYPAEDPIEAAVLNEDIKYYLSDGRLNVPKRSVDEVLITTFLK